MRCEWRARLAIGVIAVVVLWVFYGFRYNARPDGLRSILAGGVCDAVAGRWRRRGFCCLARLHVLPESYLYGLVDVRRMANGLPSYFLGKVYAHGIWYYFPTCW